jgi:RNA polymerase sigma-70 factor (ECF subfamily)
MTTAPTATAPTSDRALLERAGRGDERALGTLYDRHAGPLHALAYRITAERADAEEVVLETFCQAWREAARFEAARGSVAAWLTMLCRSRALDLVRARGRRARLADRAAAADPEAAPAMSRGADDPAGRSERLEQARQVADALAILSAPQRQAIELAYYDGLSHSEIAERLGEPLGTVKTRVRLAMQKLRDALRPYYAEARP